jgi:hypothetical protein
MGLVPAGRSPKTRRTIPNRPVYGALASVPTTRFALIPKMTVLVTRSRLEVEVAQRDHSSCQGRRC